jgi:flagellar biosynthesis protein FlhB
MATENGQQRTEKATPRRRERARREGDAAYSADLTSAAGLVGLAILFDAGGEEWAAGLGRGIQQVASAARIPEWTVNHTVGVSRWLGLQVLAAAGLAAMAVMGMTMLAGVAQIGFRITTTPLQLNFGRLAFSHGWTRFFSMDNAARAITVLLKMVLVTIVAAGTASNHLEEVKARTSTGLHQSVAFGSDLLSRVLWASAAAALAVGVADLAWQRWRREKRLKMSRTELKQEQKEDGGDPQVRAKIRKLQREVSKRKGLRDVPGATVVLTNPTHYAVAIKYDRASNGAPKVVAKGSGPLARQIVRIARANGVPILERKPLTRALYKYVDIGKEVPSDFYQAIAEILAFLYRQKRAG